MKRQSIAMGPSFVRHQRHRLQITCLLLASWGYSASPDLAAYTPSTSTYLEAIRSLDNTAKRWLQKTQEPGLAIGIVHGNEILFVRGYGVQKIGKPQPVNPETVFQLGSVSKPISATLMAILQKKGALHVYEPVGAYFSDFTPVHNPASIQLWHLLSHTSGWSRYGFNQQIERYSPRQAILQRLGHTNPHWKPGEKYDYHNVVFSLIEDVSASKTDRPFRDLLKTHVFHPLRMRHSSSSYQELMQTANKAWPHGITKQPARAYKTAGGRKSTASRPSYRYVPYRTYSQAYYERACAAAGINSNIVDLLAFLRLQLGERPDLIARSELEIFHTPHAHSPDVAPAFRKYFPRKRLQAYYGLGWRILDIQGTRLVYHGGWLKGFTNFLGFLPDWGIGIVILHHAESRLSTELAMHFIQQLLRPPPRPVITAHQSNRSGTSRPARG